MEPFGSIFTLELRNVMEEIWETVVAEALDRGIRESNGRAVTGAKLRQLVDHVGSNNGVTYPPPGFESTNFSEFLKYFDSIAVVLRRRAQDILVAPVNHPELLLGISSTGNQSQIRTDLFDAFTRIPREIEPRLPWYEPALDRVKWLPQGEGEANPTLIPIPPASRDQEIHDRRTFTDSLQAEQDTIDNLRRVLDEAGSSVLWSFSQIMRASQLSRKWHEYRFQLVTSRIRRWSEAQHVRWQESWLVAPSDGATSDAQIEAAVELASDRASLKGLFSALDEEDLKRVIIPLDIVLKLFRR
jgi:hypothetical protein